MGQGVCRPLPDPPGSEGGFRSARARPARPGQRVPPVPPRHGLRRDRAEPQMTTLGVTSRSRVPSRTREPWPSSSESRVVVPSAWTRATRRPSVVGSIWKKATSPGASVPVLEVPSSILGATAARTSPDGPDNSVRSSSRATHRPNRCLLWCSRGRDDRRSAAPGSRGSERPVRKHGGLSAEAGTFSRGGLSGG